MASMLGKVAVVLGGIGSETAQHLLEQGFALVINEARNADEAEAVADTFRRNHRTAMIVRSAAACVLRE